MQLSVGGFEDGPTGNRGIGGFLIRGDDAKAIKNSLRDEDLRDQDLELPDKRRKLDHGGIQHFFSKRESSREESGDYSDTSPQIVDEETGSSPFERGDAICSRRSQGNDEVPAARDPADANLADESYKRQEIVGPLRSPRQVSFEAHFCDRCNASMPHSARTEHNDWHYARDLQAQESTADSRQVPEANLNGGGFDNAKKSIKIRATKGSAQAPNKVTKGQSQLTFGRS